MPITRGNQGWLLLLLLARVGTVHGQEDLVGVVVVEDPSFPIHRDVYVWHGLLSCHGRSSSRSRRRRR